MRLFVALDVGENIQMYLNDIQRKIDTGDARLKFVAGYHITLKFLGDLENSEKIVQALSNIEFNSFEITTKGIGYFGKGKNVRVIWAGIEPQDVINSLQQKIDNKLSKIGFEKEKKFHPHVTLARVKHLKNRDGLIDTIKNIEKQEVSSRVNSIVLYMSTLTRQGPIYNVIARIKAQDL